VPPSEERARHVIGLGLHEALRYAVPELEDRRHGELAERYRHHYLSQDKDLLLFEGIRDLLHEMTAAGFILGVATGKSRKGLERAMAVSGLGPLFHATRCADECHSKPHPQMIEQLLAEFGVAAEATLMIGDTTHDLEMARNAGVGGLAVAYGAHPRAELEALGPLHCAESVEDLAAWLRLNA
jgi:phosphoglycolate phosphatase